MLFADLNGECQRVECQNRGPVQGKEDPTSQEIDIWMPNWMLRPDTHALERVVDWNIQQEREMSTAIGTLQYTDIQSYATLISDY